MCLFQRGAGALAWMSHRSPAKQAGIGGRQLEAVEGTFAGQRLAGIATQDAALSERVVTPCAAGMPWATPR